MIKQQRRNANNMEAMASTALFINRHEQFLIIKGSFYFFFSVFLAFVCVFNIGGKNIKVVHDMYKVTKSIIQ